MEPKLPNFLERQIFPVISDLEKGFYKKDINTYLEDFVRDASEEQEYIFLKCVYNGLVESFEEHQKVCEDPDHCLQSVSSEKAINVLNIRLGKLAIASHGLNKTIIDETPNHPPGHTTARQVLAMSFLLEYAKIKVDNDKAAERFLHFLTGKSKGNLYKLWRNPYNKDVFEDQVEDLRFIRKFFYDLGAAEIVKMIDNKVDSKDW